MTNLQIQILCSYYVIVSICIHSLFFGCNIFNTVDINDISAKCRRVRLCTRMFATRWSKCINCFRKSKSTLSQTLELMYKLCK